jgi:hypothetical protein
MVGITSMLCTCGNQMIFQPVRGSCFCSSCGRGYWIDDTEDTYWAEGESEVEWK